MGQEWAASTPFIFFTDHNEDLGKLITEGRRREFKDFAAFHTPEARDRIPDPQSEKSFTDSRLVWDELRDEKKSLTLELYKKCLALRRLEPAFRPATRDTWHVEALELGAGAIRFAGSSSDWLILFDFEGSHAGPLADEWICKPRAADGWSVVLTTAAREFGGPGSCAYDHATHAARFTMPELVVLQS